MARPSSPKRLLSAKALQAAAAEARRTAGQDSSHLRLSRRDMLGLATIAAVTPSLSAAASALRSPAELHETPGRVAFILDGEERWCIDVRRFSGRPQLSVTRTPGMTRVALSGARFPGTPLPADLTCELRSGRRNTHMTLQMTLGGFACEVPLEAWLAGERTASSPISLPARQWTASAGAKLHLAGKGHAVFSPKWVLTCAGDSLGRVDGWGECAADSVTIGLADPQGARLLNNSPQRVSSIQFLRGSASWRLTPPIASPPGGTWFCSENAFSVLRFEQGETRSGHLRQAGLAVAAPDSPPLWFCPEEEWSGEAGHIFALPLRSAACVWNGTETSGESRLSAEFDQSPVWLHLHGFALEVGGEGAPPFEMAAHGAHVTRIRCAPRLHRMTTPIGGASAQPTAATQGSVNFYSEQPLFHEAAMQTARPSVGDGAPAEAPPAQPPTPAPEKRRRRSPIIIFPPILRLPSPVRPSTPAEPSTPPATAQDAPPPVARPVPDQTPPPTPPTRQSPTRTLPEIIPGLRLRIPPLRVPPRRLPPIVTEKPPLPVGRPSPEVTQNGPLILSVVRPEDLLVLKFRFIGFQLEVKGDGTSTLILKQPVIRPPMIIMELPGQNTAEISFNVTKPISYYGQDAVPPVLSRMAGPSRLVFVNSNAISHIPYTLPGILDACGALPMNIAPTARLVPNTDLSGGPIHPSPADTAIECPRGLTISPNELAAWAHSPVPVRGGGHTELWHTRLGVRGTGVSVDEQNSADRTLRAIDAYKSFLFGDAEDGKASIRQALRKKFCFWLAAVYDPADMMALTRSDRAQLVRLMADDRIAGRGDRLMQTERLMLSALGAWMKTRYSAPLPASADGSPVSGLDIIDWRHDAAMGRNQYVRVAHAGYLYPFGHPAVWTDIWERHFDDGPAGITAYLRFRSFVTVQKPVMEYPQQVGAGPLPLPYVRVRITTTITPNLDKGAPTSFAWPTVNNNEFPFHLSGEDWDGRISEFTAPLIWVSAGATNLAAVAAAYAKPDTKTDEENARPLLGQKVAFAASRQTGDTSFHTDTLTFDATLLPPVAGQAPFRPRLKGAAVRVPAIQKLLGPAAADSMPIGYHASYLAHGFDGSQNIGEVFVEPILPLFSSAPALAFPPAQSGGLVTPNISLTGLSRRFGPIGGDPASLAAGTFDPSSFFAGAKILGGISLADIVQAAFGDLTVPQLTAVTEKDGAGLPVAETVRYAWQPQVKKNSVFLPNDTVHGLTVDATLRTPLNAGSAGAGQTQTKVVGTLRDFSIELAQIILIPFQYLQFTSETGKKIDVSAALGNSAYKTVTFLGPLSFINALASIIPGFSDPPAVDISPQGVNVNYTLALPDISLGFISASNLKMSAALNLPFTGAPVRFRFAFAERSDPFLLSGDGLAGGGFFGIALGLDGMELLEASLEAGGSIALNVGVASGGISLMVGIYFKLDKSTGSDAISLTGYVRASGAVEVLELVCLTIEFMMSLTYQAGGTVTGEASVSVEISIAFFSKSVSFTVQKTFAGSGSASLPPGPFAPARLLAEDLAAEDAWHDYCAAFAPLHEEALALA